MSVTLTERQFEDFLLRMAPKKVYKKNQAVHEAIEWNIFQEYNALKRLIKESDNQKYQIARFKMLGYIINCIREDPENGDWPDKQNYEELKEAGRLLYEDDGMRGMHDTLVWSFIPKRYRREIDMAWDGIGEWRG